MTKDDFLARCGNAYDAGLIRPKTLRLLDAWLDFVLRFEGGQMKHVADFMESEAIRTSHFAGINTLANDMDGYDLIRLSAILNHHCQACATDPKAWWTRGSLCEHSKVVRGVAWRDCLTWAIGEPEIVARFEKETGLKLFPSRPRSPIERMVDEACGLQSEMFDAFIVWFNENIWGTDETDGVQ